MKLLMVILPVLLLFACTSRNTSMLPDQRPVSLAEPVDGWPGVNNMYHDGKTYFAGQPDAASIQRWNNELGATTVINLRRDTEMEQLGFDEPQTVAGMGMRYYSIPMGADFSRADVDEFATIYDSTDGPIVIHCGSSNRVGGLWAAYLAIYRDIETEEAIGYGRAAGLSAESIENNVRAIAGAQPR